MGDVEEYICINIVGNKARVNLATVVIRKQNTPNFPINEHYVYVSWGKECSFSENLV